MQVDNQLLIVRSANQCINEAKGIPVPKMLFSEFWHEGELCILFADTNLGKSILAVQIADSVSLGKNLHGFSLESKEQPVLYFDFEMNDKQFEKRYSNNYEDHYCFSENLYRVMFNPNCTDYDQFELQLFVALEHAIIETGSKIVIIDNITYLIAQAVETAKEALPLMKKLKELKIRYNLSILVLAHTPKRNSANPLGKNDLAGSKHLANFADSIFAIGESHQMGGLRYLKQIKARATELIYDASNVVVCSIVQDRNFLKFQFEGFGYEGDHIKQDLQNGLPEIDQMILELKKLNPSISNYKISQELGTNQMRVKRVLERNAKKY